MENFGLRFKACGRGWVWGLEFVMDVLGLGLGLGLRFRWRGGMG